MPATQLSNGSQSHGLTNRRSNSSQIKENYRASLSLHRGEACNFVACSGRKTNFENGCSLSARHGKFLATLVKHRRKPPFSLVGRQLSSDFEVGTSEFERENDIDSFGNDPSALTEVRTTQSNSRNVKLDLLALSVPAIVRQAIDPLAQLMETAYIGRLGSVELGSAGVSLNIFNYISKLFNIPLLSIATSFVAEDISKYETKASASEKSILEGSTNCKPSDGADERNAFCVYSINISNWDWSF